MRRSFTIRATSTRTDSWLISTAKLKRWMGHRPIFSQSIACDTLDDAMKQLERARKLELDVTYEANRTRAEKLKTLRARYPGYTIAQLKHIGSSI